MNQQTESATHKHTFLERFRDLFNEKGCSQEELGKAIGAARSTVATWLDGRTAPNAYMVKAIAEYFAVSADYLLGLSDVASTDVNARAAVEYTGLSEEAVESLHDGLNNLRYAGVEQTAEEKKGTLRAASALIASQAFGQIASNLERAEERACLEGVVVAVSMQHPIDEDPELEKEKKKARANMAAELLLAMGTEEIIGTESSLEKAKTIINESLEGDRLQGLLTIRESCDRALFLATKAFNTYLADLEKRRHLWARQRLENQSQYKNEQ